jgi:hypothetical protein
MSELAPSRTPPSDLAASKFRACYSCQSFSLNQLPLTRRSPPASGPPTSPEAAVILEWSRRLRAFIDSPLVFSEAHYPLELRTAAPQSSGSNRLISLKVPSQTFQIGFAGPRRTAARKTPFEAPPRSPRSTGSFAKKLGKVLRSTALGKRCDGSQDQLPRSKRACIPGRNGRRAVVLLGPNQRLASSRPNASLPSRLVAVPHGILFCWGA